MNDAINEFISSNNEIIPLFFIDWIRYLHARARSLCGQAPYSREDMT